MWSVAWFHDKYLSEIGFGRGFILQLSRKGRKDPDLESTSSYNRNTRLLQHSTPRGGSSDSHAFVAFSSPRPTQDRGNPCRSSWAGVSCLDPELAIDACSPTTVIVLDQLDVRAARLKLRETILRELQVVTQSSDLPSHESSQPPDRFSFGCVTHRAPIAEVEISFAKFITEMSIEVHDLPVGR